MDEETNRPGFAEVVGWREASQRIGANVLNRSKIAESFNGGKLDGHESR